MTAIEALGRLESMEDVVVFAKDIAPVLGVKPSTLVYKAKNPGKHPLPFKFVILGESEGREQVHFNRLSFLDWVKGGKRR